MYPLGPTIIEKVDKLIAGLTVLLGLLAASPCLLTIFSKFSSVCSTSVYNTSWYEGGNMLINSPTEFMSLLASSSEGEPGTA